MTEQLIFIRIPKNASTSLYEHTSDFNLIKKNKNLLEKKLKNTTLFPNFFCVTHAKPDLIASILGEHIFKNFSFCVVRNPWDRIISAYEFMIQKKIYKYYSKKKPLSFLEFCLFFKEQFENQNLHLLSQQYEWIEGSFPPTHILKFENLKEEFKKMLIRYKLNYLSPFLPHHNKSNYSFSKNYYNSETKAIVEKIYSKDIQKFGYSFPIY